MQKLLLVDGNAIIHRAYHALPPLTDPKGNVVNAVYGFFSMLFSIIKELDPAYVIVCFDRSKSTIRQGMYAGYHEKRPDMANDLVPQIKMLDDALEQMKVAIYSVDGYEADDLIGTFSYQILQMSNATNTTNKEIEPIETIILTGDRDMLQLVNKTTKVLMPIVGVKNTVLFDEAAVKEKYGVSPSQFIDYKALIGDASDGYPGVTGIGPKTAATLLNTYGSFEDLYLHIGKLPEKYALKLATDAEQAALAKKLATIMIDAPVKLDLEKCEYSKFDVEEIMNVFNEFGFNSLIKRFGGQLKELEMKKVQRKSGEQLGLL